MPARHKRYLSGKIHNYEHFVETAKRYVENTKVQGAIDPYHYMKPYDRLPNNELFYRDMYYALNMLQAMNITPKGRILEVGSGSGWLTEMLIGLGYAVDALEPSEDFNQIAQQRTTMFFEQHRLSYFDGSAPRVHFHTSTLEECNFPDNSFDGIIFFASLHHIIDEDTGLATCFRVLKPGGCLGVSCEGAWIPDRPDEMKIYDEEMAKYGTFENPFTREYLDEALTKHSFAPVIRYHQVNGWFRIGTEKLTIEKAAQVPAKFSNCLIAHKPLGKNPTTDSPNAHTKADIKIVESTFDSNRRQLRVKLKLSNIGGTVWLHQPKESGWVTVALFQGNIGTTSFLESSYRAALPKSVLPGESIELTITYPLPEYTGSEDWYIDLVNEEHFWFSMRGTIPAKVKTK